MNSFVLISNLIETFEPLFGKLFDFNDQMVLDFNSFVNSNRI